MSGNKDSIEGSSLNKSDPNEFIQKFIIYLDKLCYLFFFDDNLTNNYRNSYSGKSVISSKGSLINDESQDVINRFIVSSEYPALIIECINHTSGIYDRHYKH
jgi:hypothetical protein